MVPEPSVKSLAFYALHGLRELNEAAPAAQFPGKSVIERKALPKCSKYLLRWKKFTLTCGKGFKLRGSEITKSALFRHAK